VQKKFGRQKVVECVKGISFFEDNDNAEATMLNELGYLWGFSVKSNSAVISPVRIHMCECMHKQ
jgi:hypothetical protein